ncbi:MAG: acyl-ACP--UDP-N-acetylglucosamine O-acyltransferase [Ignavibacteriaceae bacterium]|nr:acyl-ACP--UDP-N-acetylglucosamine O-acyltransferase [Ignavibacteriaceae bacterium]
MNLIHPTAIVSSKAKLGTNVSIGPFSIIQDDVEIGDNTSIASHSVIYNGARIGSDCKIFQGVSIAHIPQVSGIKDVQSQAVIGNRVTIHEFVTIHKASKEQGQTRVGSNVLLMAYAHLGHDSSIGDNCIIANAVQIAGHVHIDDWAIIGGSTPVHQFCFVGKHCMIGGGFRVVKDVPPYVLAGEEPLRFNGLNSVGLKRRGFSSEQLENLKHIYKLIYDSGMNVTQAKEAIKEKYSSDPLAKDVTEFIEKSKRGIIPR